MMKYLTRFTFLLACCGPYCRHSRPSVQQCESNASASNVENRDGAPKIVSQGREPADALPKNSPKP
jgi:hypothetical protein